MMSALKLDPQYNDEAKQRIRRHLVSQARKNFKVGGMNEKKEELMQGMCATATKKDWI